MYKKTACFKARTYSFFQFLFSASALPVHWILPIAHRCRGIQLVINSHPRGPRDVHVAFKLLEVFLLLGDLLLQRQEPTRDAFR
jgi:hypothetical protein